jgi:hypothetical protein
VGSKLRNETPHDGGSIHPIRIKKATATIDFQNRAAENPLVTTNAIASASF